MGIQKGTKLTPEQVAKRTEARRKNKKAKLAALKVEAQNEKRGELLPLRIVPAPRSDDVEEFGRFLGAAWRAYKGR